MDVFLHFAAQNYYIFLVTHTTFCWFPTCESSCPRLATRLRAVPAQYIFTMCFIKTSFKAINAMIILKKRTKKGGAWLLCVQNSLCKSYVMKVAHTSSQNIQFFTFYHTPDLNNFLPAALSGPQRSMFSHWSLAACSLGSESKPLVQKGTDRVHKPHGAPASSSSSSRDSLRVLQKPCIRSCC